MLRYLLAGESHGPALVGILEGFPAGLVIKEALVNAELDLRRQGYGRGVRVTTIEQDRVEFLAGFWKGRTLGSPIAFTIANRDHELRKGKPAQRWKVPRPGHADLPGVIRYGYDDCAPVAERASARSTAAYTAAGACAKALLAKFGVTVLSHVKAVGGVEAAETRPTPARLKRIRKNRPLRCLDAETENRMTAAIDAAVADGVTIGGVFEVVAFGVPAGLGTYAHPDRRLDARLAAEVMGIPAVKAMEIGDGMTVAGEDGRTAHDEIFPAGRDRVRRGTNRAGGLEGGVTNGEPVVVRGFVKPISSQKRRLASVDLRTGKAARAAWVRSDTCVVPAAGIVAEAAVAWCLADELTSLLGGDNLDVMLRRSRELTGWKKA